MPSVSQAAQQADEERRALQFGFEGTLARELVDMDVVRAQAATVRRAVTAHAGSAAVDVTAARFAAHSGLKQPCSLGGVPMLTAADLIRLASRLEKLFA